MGTTGERNTGAGLERAEFYRVDATRKLEDSSRAALGQFMTPAPIARFMASLFKRTGGEVEVLDPGAGVGTLTAAVVDEFCRRKDRPEQMRVRAVEVDPALRDYLESTLGECCLRGEEYGIRMKMELDQEDFIVLGRELVGADLFHPSRKQTFSHVIMNPPYRKIGSSSQHRKVLRSLGIEASNLYAGFVALGVKLLKPHGELVAIVPRSFCNGPYFRPFRDLLLKETALKHLHVFESRASAFEADAVLQENVVLHAVKGGRPGSVTISASHGSSFFTDPRSGEVLAEDLTRRTVHHDSVVRPNDPQKFIHIASSELEQRVLERVGQFTTRLDQLGVEVSTGPVVDFRLKDDLRPQIGKGRVPLLYPVHFQGGRLEWPRDSRKPNAIRVSDRSRRWLFPNEGHLVVTRRFTSKEEKRRVVASVYDGSLPGELIGLENHLNVFHSRRRGLPSRLARGLAVFLNSTLIDQFFRQFNGHTQVNATDLRALPYPDRPVLERLGSRAGKGKLTQREIDDLLEEEMVEMAGKKQSNPLRAKEKIDEALTILKALGLPRGQQNDRSALTLLALVNVTPGMDWSDAESPLRGITPIMEFCREHYGSEYAPNTRETFRRQTMHQFVDAGIAVYNPDQPKRPVNSPKACYQICEEALGVVQAFGRDEWGERLAAYVRERRTLAERYAREREMEMIPVRVADGEEIALTPGAHSELIGEILREFGPRFVPGGEVIYVGDTGEKVGYFKRERLLELGVEVDRHGKMPDVVIYSAERNWLLLIEAVTSHGPVDAKRHGELSALFSTAKPGLVYVTAFPDRATMARYLGDICWETEVWVAEAPSHMIHFDGVRFLGPYER